MSKNVTAPRRWRSSPDSPPTQLAYVTQPEIDMLVNANIHGSMDGKPNVGPKGIISLDGGGGDYQGSKSSGSKSTSSGGGGGGYGERLKSARDAKDKKEADAKQKAYAAQLAAKHDPGLPIVTTGKHDAEVRKIKAANKKRVLETQARLEADRKKEGERKNTKHGNGDPEEMHLRCFPKKAGMATSFSPCLKRHSNGPNEGVKRS